VNAFAEFSVTSRRSPDILDTHLKTELQPQFLPDDIYELIRSLGIVARVAQYVQSLQTHPEVKSDIEAAQLAFL